MVGRIYTGKVVRTTDFGAFVEILPNRMVWYTSPSSTAERVNKVEDVVSVGDEITVMITNIDDSGKIRLSRQAVLEGWTLEEAVAHDRPSGGRSGGSRGGGGGRRPHHDGGNATATGAIVANSILNPFSI